MRGWVARRVLCTSPSLSITVARTSSPVAVHRAPIIAKRPMQRSVRVDNAFAEGSKGGTIISTAISTYTFVVIT